MRRPSLWLGALLAAITSLPLIALFYLGEQLLGLPFFPFDLFDWLARVLPGGVVRFGINMIVSLIESLNLGETSSVAKMLEQLQALGFAVAGAALLGLLLALLMRRRSLAATTAGAIVGLLGFAMAWLVESSLGFKGDPGLPTLALLVGFAGWGMLTARWLAEESRTAASDPSVRRRVLAGTALLSLGLFGAGRFTASRRTQSGAGQPLTVPAPTPTVGSAATPATGGGTGGVTPPSVIPAPGTRPELTDNDDFYRIDINTRPVVIEESSWKLEVAGLFDRPGTVTLDELMAYPAVTQTITIGCISNRVGGDLIGTSQWSGVPLKELLSDWGIQPEAQTLYIEGADGFYEYVILEDMMDPRVLLVYGMNGETLPVEHGFPLRIYIPNRYGMKQPKWITRIEARDKWEPGYWVVRGWSKEARPRVVSVIDTVAVDDAVDGVVPVGGIAWAGDRQIVTVEVQVDDGPWGAARLKEPPLSPLTWVIWRYDWAATPGSHTLRVRAVDGDLNPQIEREQGTYPDGATGYHEVKVRV